MNDDRITCRPLARLTGGRAARAIEHAVGGVNAAGHATGQAAATITSKLAETIERPDRGLSLNDLGELQRTPAVIDRAVMLRQDHWQVPGALLAGAGPESLQPAIQPVARY